MILRTVLNRVVSWRSGNNLSIRENDVHDTWMNIGTHFKVYLK